MKKLILASNNAKKVKEIKEILEGLPIEVKSLKDEGIDIDVVEDGKTFEENAKKKEEAKKDEPQTNNRLVEFRKMRGGQS